MSKPATITSSDLPPIPASMQTPEMLTFLAASARLAGTTSAPAYWKTAYAALKGVET